MSYTDMERRILDMWPKFEDGCYVQLGDKAVANSGENKGREFIVRNVYFENGHGKLRSSMLDGCYWNWKAADPYVKRPAPKVLDADGVEIKVGDRVYSIETGNSYTVRSVNGSGTIEFEGSECKGWSSKRFTHMQPAIDADGVLIKIGDTVWHEDGTMLRVDGFGGIEDGETIVNVHIIRGATQWSAVRSLSLTHTRPDSWELLEEDAKKGNCEYLGRSQSGCDGCYLNGKSACDEYVRIDLISRAKKLAEKEAAR